MPGGLAELRGNSCAAQEIGASLLPGVVGRRFLGTPPGVVGLTSFSVAERTRQIGTRRALGARKADILRQFLLENWLITTMGLTLGVGLAYGLNIGLVNVASGAKLSGALLVSGVVLLWAAGL